MAEVDNNTSTTKAVADYQLKYKRCNCRTFGATFMKVGKQVVS